MTDQSFLDRLRGHFVPEEAYVPNPERFPRREMFILACVVLSSALSMTGLFPYVAFMTADFMHVDINKSGYYAGYVASSMMFGRLLSSVFWGRMSDRIGRKPVMYIGCSSIIIFSILFGFSVNFWMALLTRFLLGLFNPVISVARTVVSEVCAPKHQAIGMSLNIGCWSVGLVVGPAIGGLLSRPAQNFPQTFGHSSLLQKFPYLIPNIITASLALFAVILLAVAFPETLSRNKESTSKSSIEMSSSSVKSPMIHSSKGNNAHFYSKVGSDSSDLNDDSVHNVSSLNESELSTSLHGEPASSGSNGYAKVDKYGDSDEDDEDDEDAVNLSTNLDLNLEEGKQNSNIASQANSPAQGSMQGISSYALYTTDGVWQAINSQILLAFVSSTINELVPLWAVSSRGAGGLDFTSVQLGTIMTICGVGLFVCTVSIYPAMVSSFGVLNTYLTGVFLMAPVLLALSVSSSPYWGFNKHEEYSAVVIILLFVKLCDSMTFASLGTIINQTVDSSQRGLVNGLTMTLAGLGQTTGAILAATGYAWSINSDMHFPFDSHFMFFILTSICILNGTSFYLLSQRRELRATANLNINSECRTVAAGKMEVNISTEGSMNAISDDSKQQASS